MQKRHPIRTRKKEPPAANEKSKTVRGLALDSKISPILERATEVIGDRDEALRWLGTPVRGLGYATPISLLGTEDGAERVDDILGQIEHGIW